MIIIAILLILCCGGTELISNRAMYTNLNAATTDLDDFELTKLEDGTWEITKYIGSDESVVIPSTTENRVPITSIGYGAFAGKKGIKSVQIPQGITNIATRAFGGCSNLVSINIPNGVKNIGDYALAGTNIKRIRLPESVTNIGESAFQSCYNLYEINIPKGVTTINPSTFYSCAIESIEIPEGVTSIGYNAFIGCKNLRNIELPEKLETIYSSAFAGCDALTCVVIPDGVTWIDSWAFSNCDNLSKLIIPDSVTRFGTTEGVGIYNNGTIYCKKGSNAENYANKYGASYKITCITDNELPVINNVIVNPVKWTNGDVVITVDAEDSKVGLYRKAYSFDGGVTWQEENTKTFTENTNGIIIAVRDNLANTATYQKKIDITNIDKEAPVIFDVTKSTEEPIKGAVTLTIEAADDISDLADLPYSFDGGWSWQSSNSKTYTYNISGLTIKVKDKAGNIATYGEKINITNIIPIKALKVTKSPEKTEYYGGENFDSTGMVVVAVYEDGEEVVTTDYTIESGINMLCLATKVRIHSGNDWDIYIDVPITMKHKYKETVIEPTCTEQGYTTRKCEACNIPTIKENYVDALGHSYTNYVSDENATCTKDGTKTAKCDRCSTKDTIADVGSALGHSYTNYVSDKNATCTEDGTKTARCDNGCNKTNTIADIGSALGHSYTNYVSDDNATCTETGLTEGKHCSECKEVLLKQEVVDALGHDHKATVTEPTCTEQGYTTHKCTRCEDMYKDTYTNALGHNYENYKCTHCDEEAPRITVTTEKYEISEDNITKIPNGITVSDLKENITITNATEIKFLNKKNEEIEDGDTIGTGTIIVLKSEFETKTYKLVVAGDVTGDGIADFKDIVRINRFRLHKILELF